MNIDDTIYRNVMPAIEGVRCILVHYATTSKLCYYIEMKYNIAVGPQNDISKTQQLQATKSHAIARQLALITCMITIATIAALNSVVSSTQFDMIVSIIPCEINYRNMKTYPNTQSTFSLVLTNIWD